MISNDWLTEGKTVKRGWANEIETLTKLKEEAFKRIEDLERRIAILELKDKRLK